MRRHAWRYVSKRPVLAGYDWTWRCALCRRQVVVFKTWGADSNLRYARPLVGDPGHAGVSGDCDVECVRSVLES